MAVLDNTITTDDVNYSLDVELIQNFNQDVDVLENILGIVSPEVVAAGTALYQLTVDGELDATEHEEGDEVALSKYTVTKGDAITVAPKPYRKLTSAETILQSGYEAAVLKTDQKMLAHVRSDIMSDFYTYLANGTGEASGTSLQAALAQADAELYDTLENNADATSRAIHFVNRFDIADYLGQATITTQDAFGMSYIQNFLGLSDVIVSSKVPSGTIYVTPAENLHLYGIDFGSLSQAGLDYTVYDGSLIGVQHTGAYDRFSGETHVVSGAKLFAEVLDYIVVGTIATEA